MLGPVTAIAHAVGAGAAMAVAGLSPRAVDARLAAERGALRDLLDAVTASRLRLIVTFGSVAARYGLPGQGLFARAALAEQAEAAATMIPGGGALHIGSRRRPALGCGRPTWRQSMAAAGMAGISAGDAARLLLKVLATPGRPARSRSTGGSACPARPTPGLAVPSPVPSGRFLREVIVHYPGMRLVLTRGCRWPATRTWPTTGSTGPVPPLALALEALAQAASALVVGALRRATAVTTACGRQPAADSGGVVTIRSARWPTAGRSRPRCAARRAAW